VPGTSAWHCITFSFTLYCLISCIHFVLLCLFGY